MTAVQLAKAVVREPQIWPLSVKAYHALSEMGLIPKQTELLYGQVFHKMSKSPFHSFLAMRLLRLIQPMVPAGFLCRLEQPITCQDSEPEPDLAVVRGSEEDFWQEHPRTAELLVEVCVTSHDYDRSKLQTYARAGVKECWFVLGPEKRVEVYRRPAGDHFVEHGVHGPGGELACSVLPAIAVELDALFTK